MSTITTPTQIAIVFRSVPDLTMFKRESGCQDFYIDKDAFTLVGNFTEHNLLLATGKYNALVSIDRHHY